MFWARFSHLCEINNKKPTPVGKEIGLSAGIITTWKKEGHCPSGEMLIRIADYFGCSIDYLVGRSNNPEIQKSEFSKEDRDFIAKLHSLPEDSRDEILLLLDHKYERLKRGGESSASDRVEKMA